MNRTVRNLLIAAGVAITLLSFILSLSAALRLPAEPAPNSTPAPAKGEAAPWVVINVPFWGLSQIFGELNRAAERVSPLTPTGFYSSTFEIGVGVVLPVKCKGTIVGQQYLPDFDNADKAKMNCTELAKTAIEANREIELARPLPTPEPMPRPKPTLAPATETLHYEIRGTNLVLLAYKGEHVLALIKNPGRKVFLLDQRWVIEPVIYLEDAWIENGIIHVTYVGADQQYIL